jgi:3-oxo-5-alpha-steroid 4-dehydrogenase 1
MSWRTGDSTYDTVLMVAMLFVAFVALTAPFVPSPYGRFSSPRFGLRLGPRLGWFLMELPATLSFLYFFSRGPRWHEPVPLLLLAVWLGHYTNRGFVFPLLIRAPKGATATFSITVVLVGWLATSLHGYLNATYIAKLGTNLTWAWLTTPRFLLGLALYYVSFALNLHSDRILRNLRTPAEVAAGQRVYRRPHGGLFEYVTCPSYLTELTGWLGFALATASPGGWYILLLSMANLVPRAIATHRWYLEKFPEYARSRKCLIPFVW